VPPPVRVSDLRGAARLAAQATVGVARIAEGVHQSVWSTLGVPGGTAPGRTRGITGLVYRSIEGVTQLVGKAVDQALAQLEPLLKAAGDAAPGTPQREAVLAALNGVMGDRLAADGNPLATRMALRRQGEATPKIALLVHGLCMNDLQWGRTHADALAGLGYTPVFVRYNSGLHIWDNGRELSQQLVPLLADWPVPVAELAIVAHSMGGLVARSACDQARRDGAQWLPQLKHLVFLGTPHQGAPLERAGNWVDVLLGATPYSAPFAKLTRLRSAGITDLRNGRVEEGGGALALPEGVACHTVAATLAGSRSLLADRLVGDGLVPLRSALGRHDDPARSLAFAKSSEWIAWRTGHLELLGSEAVARQLVHWLGAGKS
jgi:hypothetical protein